MDNCLIVCSQGLAGVPKGLAGAFSESFVVAVDGGYAHCKKFGVQPRLWVGDGDSLKKTPKGPIQKVKLPRKKDYSDLEATLHVCGEAFVQGAWQGDVILIGAQGGRFDHDIVNLLAVQQWLEKMASLVGTDQCPDVISYGVHGMWLATVRGGDFEQPKGRLFSVITFNQDTKLSISGAKYNLKSKVVEPGALGLSNEGVGKTVKIRLANGTGPAFVFFPS